MVDCEEGGGGGGEGGEESGEGKGRRVWGCGEGVEGVDDYERACG